MEMEDLTCTGAENGNGEINPDLAIRDSGNDGLRGRLEDS